MSMHAPLTTSTYLCHTVFHGYGGKMTISDIKLSPVNDIASAALKELGVKTRDTNGQNQFGKNLLELLSYYLVIN